MFKKSTVFICYWSQGSYLFQHFIDLRAAILSMHRTARAVQPVWWLEGQISVDKNRKMRTLQIKHTSAPKF